MSKYTKDKKQKQLGMNPGTASSRLKKDILFNFIQKDDIKCFHCGKEMTRENFSIEHKIPWLDSEEPKKLYFDLDNISFSHLSCNSSAARRTNKNPDSHSYRKGCRCEECTCKEKLRRRDQRSRGIKT